MADALFQSFLDESEISPGSHRPNTYSISERAEIAPWEPQDPTPARNRRKLSGARNSAHVRKGIAESVMPADVLGDALSSLSNDTPRPNADKEIIDGQYSPTSRDFQDERRPSYAGTIGSDSSSRRDLNQKKIFGFFGEDPSGCDVPQAQRSSLHIHPSNLVPDSPESWTRPSCGRQPSFTNSISREDSNQSSPKPSRPRTPQPSSDVTPWMFQDREVGVSSLCRK